MFWRLVTGFPLPDKPDRVGFLVFSVSVFFVPGSPFSLGRNASGGW